VGSRTDPYHAPMISMGRLVPRQAVVEAQDARREGAVSALPLPSFPLHKA
jgi:hypothetical protein